MERAIKRWFFTNAKFTDLLRNANLFLDQICGNPAAVDGTLEPTRHPHVVVTVKVAQKVRRHVWHVAEREGVNGKWSSRHDFVERTLPKIF